MKFYTSDLHFDHSNILEYEHRPWKNIEEMNKGIALNINLCVKKEDELYILGDFTLRSSQKRIRELRNMIACNHVHLITGNHDYFAKREWAKDLFETVQPYKEIHDGEYKVILCHFPIMYWNKMDEGAIHLYGHVHSRKGMQHPHRNAFNVGVDVNQYCPVTINHLVFCRNRDIDIGFG